MLYHLSYEFLFSLWYRIGTEVKVSPFQCSNIRKDVVMRAISEKNGEKERKTMECVAL